MIYITILNVKEAANVLEIFLRQEYYQIMLTKDDLNQIRQVVKEETTSLDKRVGSLETKVDSLEKSMNKGFKRIEKILGQSFDYLDKRYLNHERRIKRVESTLDLPPISEL
ncbi:hypothetical protein C4578_02490 [Candidatus Microgenomates bacterium]|jgi:hypothetical protein|nr:MAG: hypothetical protein C4578_02490 [Candidatus Microgenomates bacterium]